LAGVIEDSIHRQGQFQISQQTRVDDPMTSIESFSQRFGLSQSETEVVRRSYHLEPGATMFHIINAFTRAGRDSGLDTAQTYRLEKAGGQILGLVKAQ
jgi:hypothetical protein